MREGPEFDALVIRWTPVLERWAYRMECRHPGTDWWPSAGRSLWKAARTWEAGKGTFSTWLWAIVRGEMSGTRRRHRRECERLPRAALFEGLCRWDAPSEECPEPESTACLSLLDHLPEDQREVVGRIVLDGRGVRAVARDLSTSHMDIQRRYARAMATLRAMAGAREPVPVPRQAPARDPLPDGPKAIRRREWYAANWGAVLPRLAALKAAGLGSRKIAARLNSEGVPCPTGRPWAHESIRRAMAMTGTGAA